MDMRVNESMYCYQACLPRSLASTSHQGVEPREVYETSQDAMESLWHYDLHRILENLV